MAALHHVSVALDDVATWSAVLDAVEAGDSVVLLDAAARAVQCAAAATIAAWQALVERRQRAAPGTRWLLPIAEQLGAASTLPAGIVVIADELWLALIIEHPLLLEWN